MQLQKLCKQQMEGIDDKVLGLHDLNQLKDPVIIQWKEPVQLPACLRHKHHPLCVKREEQALSSAMAEANFCKSKQKSKDCVGSPCCTPNSKFNSNKIGDVGFVDSN